MIFIEAANDKVSGIVPTLDEVYQFFQAESPNLMALELYIPPIYEHWMTRRFTENNGLQITPLLKV